MNDRTKKSNTHIFTIPNKNYGLGSSIIGQANIKYVDEKYKFFEAIKLFVLFD